ncbi:interferon-induced GTP-binding protein Mx1 [Colletotrichum salicis]|uniref:Interferon-induced GTP-binding protein Mx1 n=1 Tax=Colletotrichum salicis TaxID=1209931 RepID=A0A135T2M9_9PEZI|nr:interferon-induced GTP-binding protein Mx1 [Colletotrichum salicis]
MSFYIDKTPVNPAARTIDKLRELGIAGLVPLPQLVVVGDQSSGKSSVLESVTGFNFPRAPELCTRYATQISCRRDDSESVQISIIPSQDSDEDRKERLKKFVFSVEKNDLALADVFKKYYLPWTNEAMGLRGVNDGDDSKLSTFAEDILKIEINSPTQHHLTVIDLPGIFRTSTKGLTTDNDIVIVRNMVNRYIKDQRTIILAVVPCNVDIATQEPDLATERATQKIVCELIEARMIAPRRMTDRNSSEKAFFSANPWTRLRATNRVGVDSLSARLRDLLRGLSKKEFKNVKIEVQRMLNNSETELKRMGPSRPLPDAQRRYLGQIASDFQDIALRAREGRYNGSDFLNQNKLRLITGIVHFNESFNSLLAVHDHTVSLLGKIEDLLHKSRTAELGSFSGSVLAQAFKQQTKKWEPLVLRHVSQAIILVHSFIRVALRLKCTDKNTFDELHEHLLLPNLRASYQRALEHAQFLIDVELSGQPSTMNHYFNSNLQVLQAKRLVEAIHKAIGPATSRNTQGNTPYFSSPSTPGPAPKSTGSMIASGWWVSRSMIPKPTTDRSNAKQIRQDIHDILCSYYKVARKRFVDVVLQQAVFHFLLDAKTSPFKIFTPDLVMGLDDEQMQIIAGEDEATRGRRQILARDIENPKLTVEELRLVK